MARCPECGQPLEGEAAETFQQLRDNSAAALERARQSDAQLAEQGDEVDNLRSQLDTARAALTAQRAED